MGLSGVNNGVFSKPVNFQKIKAEALKNLEKAQKQVKSAERMETAGKIGEVVSTILAAPVLAVLSLGGCGKPPADQGDTQAPADKTPFSLQDKARINRNQAQTTIDALHQIDIDSN